MQVKVLNEADSLCDDFVAGMAGHKLCHLYAWSRMVAECTGHRPFYLVAYDGDSIEGILPLMLVRSRLFGTRMISQAFHTYGGPLACGSETIQALYRYAVDLADEHMCDYVEFRNVDPMPYDLYLRSDKVAMHLPLEGDAEKLWDGFKGEVRNRVRKAQKSGVVVSLGGLDLLDEFYKVWTVRMHELGTPAYPKKLMKAIFETFKGNSWVFLVRLEGKTIGGAFTTNYNGFADIQWVATLGQYNNLGCNMLLYWSVIKHHCEFGGRCFDFGRCTIDGPTYEFKRRWGAQPVKLNYQYWVKPGKKLSLAVPDSSRYSRKVAIWKRLPLWMTRLAGPYLSRNLP